MGHHQGAGKGGICKPEGAFEGMSGTVWWKKQVRELRGKHMEKATRVMLCVKWNWSVSCMTESSVRSPQSILPSHSFLNLCIASFSILGLCVCCKDKLPAPCEESVCEQKLVLVAGVRWKVWVPLACGQLWERVKSWSQPLEEWRSSTSNNGVGTVCIQKTDNGVTGVVKDLSAASCSRSSEHSPCAGYWLLELQGSLCYLDYLNCL